MKAEKYRTADLYLCSCARILLATGHTRFRLHKRAPATWQRARMATLLRWIKTDWPYELSAARAIVDGADLIVVVHAKVIARDLYVFHVGLNTSIPLPHLRRTFRDWRPFGLHNLYREIGTWNVVKKLNTRYPPTR